MVTVDRGRNEEGGGRVTGLYLLFYTKVCRRNCRWQMLVYHSIGEMNVTTVYFGKFRKWKVSLSLSADRE